MTTVSSPSHQGKSVTTYVRYFTLGWLLSAVPLEQRNELYLLQVSYCQQPLSEASVGSVPVKQEHTTTSGMTCCCRFARGLEFDSSSLPCVKGSNKGSTRYGLFCNVKFDFSPSCSLVAVWPLFLLYERLINSLTYLATKELNTYLLLLYFLDHTPFS